MEAVLSLLMETVVVHPNPFISQESIRNVLVVWILFCMKCENPSKVRGKVMDLISALYNNGNTAETSAFNNLWNALSTTLFAGMFGDFDLGILNETYSTPVAVIIMIVMLILVMIISLNALIAFISEEFEQVLAKKQAVLKKAKAQMIIEVYGSLTKEERKKIEREHRWTSIVIPSATLEVQESKAVDTNFAKATKEYMNKLTMTNKIMKGDIDEVKDGMKVMKDGIVMKDDIDGMVMK